MTGVNEVGPLSSEPPIPTLKRSGPVPLYYQLQEVLKQEIENGRWQPGDLLPSEAEMNSIFGVSRSVTRKALDILEGDGQVYRINGKGTIVAQPKFRYEAVSAAAEWGAGDGISPTLSAVVAIGRVPAGGHVGRLLHLAPGDDVFELTYVQSVGDAPASLTNMFVKTDATPELEKVDRPELLEGGPEATIQLNETYGFVIVESRLSVEATRTNTFEAERLDIAPDSPVFLVGSLELGRSEQPLAFARSVVRSDHFRFSVVLQHEGQRLANPPIGAQLQRQHSWSND